MEIVQITLLIAVFLLMALLMFFRLMPALIALPLMAVGISFIGGISLNDTIELVVGQGALKLYPAYTVAMFGSMLSVILQKTGVAESFIKKGAELSGDNPWYIAVIMLSLITLLFSTLGGLGAIIMVATIVMPIMSSIGIGPMTTVGIFLFGLCIGGILNVGNWAVYISVMGLKVEQVSPFALVMFGISFAVALVYITVQLYRDGQDIKLRPLLVKSALFLALAAACVGAYFHMPAQLRSDCAFWCGCLGAMAKFAVGAAIALLFVFACFRAVTRKNEHTAEVHWISYFSPIIPLFLILIFKMNFIAAFITGLVYAFLSTYKKGRLNMFVQSIFEGGAMVMPAAALMFGIGMLLVAIMGPGGSLPAYPNGWPVLNLLQPLMKSIVPTGPYMYAAMFTLAAPLALYRGPLNVWGMGYGLAAAFLASGLNPGAVMGLLMAVGQVQGISDPTNTHNVWLANEMRIDVQKVLWNTIPYTWAIACLGLAVSAFMFMR